MVIYVTQIACATPVPNLASEGQGDSSVDGAGGAGSVSHLQGLPVLTGGGGSGTGWLY